MGTCEVLRIGHRPERDKRITTQQLINYKQLTIDDNSNLNNLVFNEGKNYEYFLNMEVQVPTTDRDIIPTPDIDESAGTNINLNPSL